MSDLHIPDISEHQTTVDFTKVGPAVILRVHNGWRADNLFAQRLPAARQHCTVRGYYGYCVAGRDAATQGREMAALLGRLQPGEFCVVDLEEGTGDQSARAEAYARELDAACGGHAFLYSGAYFDSVHLTHVTGRRLWLAAYSSREPAAAHSLWQHSDNEPHPGIGPCDCSVFHGTVQQLHDLVSPPAPKPVVAPAPAPVKDTDMALIVQQPGSPTQWVVATDLSHKAPLNDSESMAALFGSGCYHRVALTAAQLARIPTIEVVQ